MWIAEGIAGGQRLALFAAFSVRDEPMQLRRLFLTSPCNFYGSVEQKKVVERGARHDTRNICSSSGSDSRLKPLVSNFCSELPFHWYESLGEQRGEEIRYAFTYVHVNGKRYKSYQPWYNFPPRALLSRRRALLKLDEKLVLASSMKRSIKTFERNLSKDFYTCSSQFIFWDKIIDEQWRNNSGLRVVHV